MREKTTECFFNIINEKNTFNVYVHQLPNSLAPTRRKHQLPEVLWHQLEGGSNPLWTPTHNLLAPSCRPDIFSGTNLKETMIPCGKSPNCHKYKFGSKLQPLLETASNHWLNHSAKSLSRSLLITVRTTADLYTVPNSVITQSDLIWLNPF